MKVFSRNVWKSVLSVVLAVCMVLGMCTTALATGNTESELKYVSLGDSMTNGYGLPGYVLNSGVETYGEASYANQFADALVDNGYADDVDHAQLSMSGMRIEDLHWLLELDYNDQEAIDLIADMIANGWNEERWNAKFTTGDFWTLDEICDHSRLDATYLLIKGGTNYDDNSQTFPGVLPDDYEYPTTYDKNADMSYGKNRAMKVALVAKYFQEHVTEADIVSVAVGNGNLGVFAFGRILEIIGFNDSSVVGTGVYNVEAAIRECDPTLQAEFLNLKDELYNLVVAEMGVDISANPMLQQLADIIVYIGVSMVLNYAGSIEAILQLNPDAEIIMVAIMNTFAEEGEVEGISVGDLMGAIVEPMNAFIAALPTYMQATDNSVYDEAKFYYAEAPMVECMVASYETAISDPESVVRARFVEDVVGTAGDPGLVWGMVGDMFNGMVAGYGLSLEYVTLEDVQAYEDFATKWDEYINSEEEEPEMPDTELTDSEIFSCAVYLAFENALLACADETVTMDSLAVLATGLGDAFDAVADALNPSEIVDIDTISGVVMDNLTTEIMNELADTLLTDPEISQFKNEQEVLYTNAINQLVAYSIYGDGAGEVTDDQWNLLFKLAKKAGVEPTKDTATTLLTSSLTSDQISDLVFGVIFDEILATYGDKVFAAVLNNESALAIVSQYVARYAAAAIIEPLAAALTSNDALSGLLALFARCYIGNGIGAHPSKNGHNALAAAVNGAYFGDYTAQDETLKNLEVVADKAIELVVEYYDDAYAYGYQYAAEQGYIGLAEDAIDGVIADIGEIDVDSLDATDEFKAEVQKTKDEILATLRAAKELLLGADQLDQETLDAVMALLDEAADIINALVDTLTQAGVDVNQLVIIPALEDAYEKLTEEVIPDVLEKLGEAVEKATDMLLEKLGDAYDAFVDAVVEAAEKYAPEVADWIYNYLYNNPEKVIAFFNEYGDEIGSFLAEYGDEALLVIAFIVMEYGDEIAEFVIANSDEIMEQMVLWVEEHGENAWALIMVYLEELGVIDAIDGVVDAITDPENIDKILEEVGKLVATYGPEVIEGLYDHLDSLGYIDAVQGIIDSLTAEADRIQNEVIPEILDVIDGLYKELEDLNAELEKLYKELESATGEAKEIIEAAIAEIEAAIEKIEAAIEALENALADITAKVEEIYAAAGDLADALDNLLDVIANAGENIGEAIDKVQDALDKVGEVIDVAKDVIDSVNDAIDNVQDLVDNAINAALELRDEVKAIVDELKNAVSELTGEAREIADNVIASIETAIEFYDMAVEAIAKAAEVLPEVIDTVQEVADVVITAINAFEETISGEYTVGAESYYVAIGNDTAYGELLAADMGLEADQFVQIGQDGVTIANIADVLDADGVAAVAAADLITVGFGNSMVLDFVAAYLAAPYELDWTALVTEDGVPYVVDALAEVEAYFAELGLDASIAEILMQAVEAYAYGYVAMAVSVPALVEAIHEINPEALVVIVGMYNPLEGVVLTHGDAKIPVGDFVDNFVQVANAELFAYALLNENTMFVDAPDVETSLAAGEYPAFGFIINFNNNIKATAPTEAGSEYIKNCILEALEVTVEEDALIGDVDLDGDVDARDASMAYAIFNGKLEASEAQLLAADVNADGEVLARDAAMIYAYHNGTLAAFPAA